MSEFIYWNMICVILWALWNIFRWILPRSVVFSVVSVGRSHIHGQNAVVLINDKRVRVFRKGILWRYKDSGAVIPDEWAEILDTHELS